MNIPLGGLVLKKRRYDFLKVGVEGGEGGGVGRVLAHLVSFLKLKALELLLLQVLLVHGDPDPLLLSNLVLILHKELSHVHVRQV